MVETLILSRRDRRRRTASPCPLASSSCLSDPDLQAQDVVHERDLVGRLDVPAQGVALHDPHDVGGGLLAELIGGQDLQEPQAGGERREHEQHQGREHLEPRGRLLHRLEPHHAHGSGPFRQPSEQGVEDRGEDRAVDRGQQRHLDTRAQRLIRQLPQQQR